MPKITKNKNGKYQFVVDLGRDPATGKRRQVRRSGFNTKREAEDELRHLQNEAEKGTIIKKRQAAVTFEKFAQDWLEWYATTAGVKESTIINRQRFLTSANKLIGAVKIRDINKKMYDHFLISLNEKYKPSTIDRIHSTVSMVLDYAVANDYLAANPAKTAKKPKTATRLEDIAGDIEEQYLTRTEADHLLQAAKELGDFQTYALLRLLLYTGLRIGEALAIETQHIDFKHALIKIRQTISTGTTANVRQFALQTPKTPTSIRDIEIDTETLEILRIQITEQKKKRLRAGTAYYTTHNFVFTSTRYPGYPCFHSTIRDAFHRCLLLAGITKPLSLHGLRHTHASLLAESGATLEQIQSRLGHASDDITRRIYLHVTKESKASMIANFATFMSS